MPVQTFRMDGNDVDEYDHDFFPCCKGQFLDVQVGTWLSQASQQVLDDRFFEEVDRMFAAYTASNVDVAVLNSLRGSGAKPGMEGSEGSSEGPSTGPSEGPKGQ